MVYALYSFQIIIVLFLSPAALGFVRKVKAWMQMRRGASIIQPYRDIIKLFQKGEVITTDASWIHLAVPYIIFGSTAALSLSVPLMTALRMPMGDMLVFVYVVAAGAFFTALAGIDSAGGFGGLGASREMTIAALTEGGFVLSLLCASLLAGTTNLGIMPASLSGISGIMLLPLALAGSAYAIVLLAENARYPMDNPATHLELTMVHEAMILEYSGKRLALIEWAAANKLFIFTALLVNIFFPWGLAVIPSALPLALVVTLIKIMIALFGVAMIESTMAKLRIFRVPDLLFTSFVLSVIGILMTVL